MRSIQNNSMFLCISWPLDSNSSWLCFALQAKAANNNNNNIAINEMLSLSLFMGLFSSSLLLLFLILVVHGERMSFCL